MHVCPQARPSEEELAPGPLPVPMPEVPQHMLLLAELPPLVPLEEPIAAAGASGSRAGPEVAATACSHARLEEGSQVAGCCLLAAGC